MVVEKGEKDGGGRGGEELKGLESFDNGGNGKKIV